MKNINEVKNEEKTISFILRVLSSTEKNCSVFHQEVLAVFYDILKFSQFLLSRKWTIMSDHKPLLVIFGNKNNIPIMSADRLQYEIYFYQTLIPEYIKEEKWRY